MSSSAMPTHEPGASVPRCPACGHPLRESDLSLCPLCGLALEVQQVTNTDVTPYGLAHGKGRRGWIAMCKWVWAAGSHRIKHVALMRSSTASRRFAWNNILITTLAVTICCLARSGWHEVANTSPEAVAEPAQPLSEGWLLVTSTPRPLAPDHPSDSPTDLWWSVPQASVAAAMGVLLTWMMIWLALLMIRGIARTAYKPPFDQEQRATAALHYSTAWLLPVAAAALMAALAPLSAISTIAGWPIQSPQSLFEISAGVIVGIAAGAWWFWLVRVGTAAPNPIRKRVTGFFVVGPPLIVVGVSVSAYFGLGFLYSLLVQTMGLGFAATAG